MNNRLVLGTVQFGLKYGIANQAGRVDPDEVEKILFEAASHGINMLDTAIAYGDSEKTLGAIGVAGWGIVSKLPALPDGCLDVAGWVETQIENSLARLGVDCLYGVMLHCPEQLVTVSGGQLLKALDSLKTQGFAKKIGVSVYSPEEIERLFSTMHFDLVQAPLNILDRRLVESGWAQRLNAQGVELHVRSAFLQGLLLMPAGKRPEKFRRWQWMWAEWDHWLCETGLTPLQACLRYALSVDGVDRVIVGVDSAAQLSEILDAASGSLNSPPSWSRNIDVDLINPSRWNLL